MIGGTTGGHGTISEERETLHTAPIDGGHEMKSQDRATSNYEFTGGYPTPETIRKA